MTDASNQCRSLGQSEPANARFEPTLPIKVAVVEDDRATLDLYAQAVIAQDGLRLVSRCDTVGAALSDLPRAQPDVVLMDIQFPVGTGIECTRRIKADLPHAAILMLTVVEDDDAVFRAVLAGADGYLLKSAPLREVVEAIWHAAQGGSPMTPVIARKVLRHLRQRTGTTAEIHSLSLRELQILQLVAQGQKDDAIASGLHLSPETVGNHLRRIYRKLHVHSRAHAAAKLASESGHLDPPTRA